MPGLRAAVQEWQPSALPSFQALRSQKLSEDLDTFSRCTFCLVYRKEKYNLRS